MHAMAVVGFSAHVIIHFYRKSDIKVTRVNCMQLMHHFTAYIIYKVPLSLKKMEMILTVIMQTSSSIFLICLI
jgi:hypothetical protein